MTGRAANGDALVIRNLSKRFGGAVALDDVSLSVRRGEVHGLLGSNGSGKSTLIKVLAGFHHPEPGAEISLYGEKLHLPVSGVDAREKGLAFVHQHLGLIPSLSVAENFYIGSLSTGQNWAINWRTAHRDAKRIFESFGLALAPEAPVGSLSAVQQALLAIVRAYEDIRHATKDHADRPGVLVLDEPTPFLPRSGVEQLFGLVRQCTGQGASVIFVSHDVDEVREITDRATVLRDGHLIDTVVTADTSTEAFVERIIGRSMERYAGGGKQRRTGAPAVTVKDLSASGVGPVSFDIGAGEILGLTGLIGSGFDNIPALLYGARSGTSGHVKIANAEIDLKHLAPDAALARGISYLPADRLGEAGVGSLPVGDNVSMPVYHKLKGPLGLTDRSIHRHAGKLGGEAGVKPNIPAMPLSALSGGNAQKALMAKWLQTEPSLLLLDEPTQGVDVGARQQIWNALDRTAAAGTPIVVASTDYEQLAQLCHRVLIFSRGHVVAELSGSDLSKDTIAERCYRSMPQVV
ncbi:sugar ABC transporter ATP-binding protein [Hoeflea sp.]|uniref:sugar ABC transporter ATP-binding protein n=1 Tax=Hoeflea sp. TaxID=1940281 RepID=UPI003B012B81